MSDPKVKTEVYGLLGGRNSKASVYDNNLTEFRDIVNMNFVVRGALTQRPGSSLYAGATIPGFITGGYEYEKLQGQSFLIVSANTNIYKATPSGFVSFDSGLKDSALFSFATFVDYLLAANGDTYFKYEGSSLYPVGLPAGIDDPHTFNAGPTSGGSLTAGITTTFIVNYGYFNNRGYFGPVNNGHTVVIDGTINNSILYQGITIPAGFGISGVLLYRSEPNGGILTGTTTVPGSSIGIPGSVTDTGYNLGSRIQSNAVQFTLIPQYLELYNNQLMMAGFSGFPSALYFSEIGEPEAIDDGAFIEFRTNDGDRITGLKSYAGKLVVSKQRSFHVLGGDDPTSFFTAEISDQYGCLSHRAMLTWEDKFWFLDTKGICQWNGANTTIVSNRIEDIFLRMNIPAALDHATAIHYKQFNEVWWAIPIDGATFNNIIAVYDYIADSWATYKGMNPSVLFQAKQKFDKKEVFFGGYTGSLSYVSSSLVNDNGAMITCIIKTRFEATGGNSSEQLYRRLYVNVNPIMGFTLPLQVNFRTNYGTTIQYSATLFTTPFQSRIDFGIPGRSIQGEMIYASASFPLQVFGYTWESRHQRSV